VRGHRTIVASCVVVVALVTSSPAAATEATLDEVAQLADAAMTNDAAADELADVTSIDGMPVDMEAILDGSGDDVARRLEAIAALGSGSNGDDADAARTAAAAARADAAEILSTSEFQLDDPRPGLANRIGEWLANLVPDEIGRALASRNLWIFLALVTLGTGLFFWIRNARRRRTGSASVAPAGGDRQRNAAEIEERARRAAANGDYSTAVRLWFEGGAVRLAEAGVVSHGPTSTSGAIRRAVPSPTMTALATTFDRVAYGGRDASRDDAEAAEHGWTAVHEAARRG